MALASGTRFGPYEIADQIGKGGMGEVYRATDTKLGREVAIKTLPSTLASDADRLARFEREAKLLATLNHAHIGAIYGLDEHEGTQYLAMELIEGETLEEKLKDGSLPVDDALRLGLQIAEALEAAHDKGVIHRDLKPANIMVTAEGQVKVVDFGLAKAFSTNPAEGSPAHSPALSVAMTQAGLVLGTAGYMSPEQASGQATDQRADIWAFGVVLYEMLTGLPLFSGESVPHILADVLKTEPDWNRLPENLHPRLKLMLERCLTKKPRNRCHSIADVRVDIESALNDPTGIAVRSAQGTETTGSKMRLAAAAVAGGLLVGLAGFAFWPEPEPALVNLFSYTLPEDQTFRNTGRRAVSMSPDGRQFVYNTPNGLFLRTMGELEARLIPGTEPSITSPTFSPDGRALVYWNFTGAKLTRIAISGGPPVGIADVPANPHGLSWGADGTILIGQPDGIWRVSENGGTPELVIPAEEGEQVYGPMLLPDGDSILFSVAPPANLDGGQIVVRSLSTGEQTLLLQGGNDARYLPTGHLVYAVEDTLRAVRFDPEGLTVSGGAVPLVQGVMRGGINTGAAQYGISNAGTLVYLPGTTGSSQTLVWVDQQGREENVDLGARGYTWARLSPDGSRVAIEIDDGANVDIWVSELSRGTLERVTRHPANDHSPTWMPGGQRILFVSTRDGGEGIFVRAADGRGEVEHLITIEGMTNVHPFDWTPDGSVLLFEYVAPDTGYDIGMLSFDGEPSWRPLLDVTGAQGAPAVHPDGNWFAYNALETGQFEIYVERFPEGGQRTTISTDSGATPVWSADGRALFYRSWTGDRPMMRVAVETEPTFTVQRPERLFTGQYPQPNGWRDWDIAPDGQRFLMIKPATGSDGSDFGQIVIVQNWFEELERLVPTD